MNKGLDESLGFLLGVAYRKVAQLFQHQLNDHNLTPEQWAVLYRISEEEGLIQREIGKRAEKDKPTTTRILVALEQKGLIRKIEGAEDRRSFRVYSTPEGKAKVREIEPLERAAMKEASADLSEEEYTLLIGLLRRVIRNSEDRLSAE
ncbi:MarR family winged helix-turn-helix transcriptional regulator [Paenibacillus physcomitrellae]|uniref:Transcriptional regulator n=1 Tax=Paenibacillus physcomitrellae TaxID=1619311 RepID=A0ABQ1GTW8_9BACL|nr:MarR family transcriptional regulator [Paenibacillus physcomitrellae]GGA50292.1 transcriptional regulator [Paenibacillus physcomitrellae]